MSSLQTKESTTFFFNKDKYSTLYGFSACDVELPYHEYDIEGGERLLIILSYVTDDDARTRKLGNSSQGLLAKKLVETLNNEVLTGVRKDLPLIKTVSLINFRDKYNERLMDADMDITSDMHKLWVTRINDYIEAYKPTRILISGDQPFKAILYHTQNQIKNFNKLEAVEYKEPWLQVGRVFDFKYNDIIIPTTFTLPLHWTSTSNPKYIEEAPNLIHQQKFHLEYLLYGRNLYTVQGDSQSWIRKDIMTMSAFEDFYQELLRAPKVCIDLETDNLARFANKILTMHFSLDGMSAYNLPMCHKDTPFGGSEINYIQTKLKDYFENCLSAEHVFHNAKFDIGVMTAQLGLKFYNHKIWDTIGGIFCFHPDTVVLTNKGGMAIRNIVDNSSEGLQILSYNHSTGEQEYKNILSTSKHRACAELLELDYGEGSIIVTSDHKVWSITRNAYVEAGTIEEGEEVMASL